MNVFQFFCLHRNLMFAGGRYAECRRCGKKIECPWDWKRIEREEARSPGGPIPKRG